MQMLFCFFILLIVLSYDIQFILLTSTDCYISDMYTDPYYVYVKKYDHRLWKDILITFLHQLMYVSLYYIHHLTEYVCIFIIDEFPKHTMESCRQNYTFIYNMKYMSHFQIFFIIPSDISTYVHIYIGIISIYILSITKFFFCD